MTPPLRSLPKVELHLHLEGCILPSEALALARREDPGVDADDVLRLYRHASFLEFLAHFGAIVGFLKGPADLAWIFDRVIGRLKRQNVAYAEIRISPSVWERHGLDPAPCMKLLAQKATGASVRCGLIVDGVRQWDRSRLERDLELALAYRDKGVVGFGLGGDEAAAPAVRFGDMAGYCRARRLPVIPHAGEALGPAEVTSAMDVFAPPRIGHGIAAVRDPAVLEEVALRGVHLEVCPTSNRRTGAVPRGRKHPLCDLWSAGCRLSLGTDDPALFGTTLHRELAWALRRGGWSLGDAVASQRYAAQASLLPAREKDALMRRLA